MIMGEMMAHQSETLFLDWKSKNILDWKYLYHIHKSPVKVGWGETLRMGNIFENLQLEISLPRTHNHLSKCETLRLEISLPHTYTPSNLCMCTFTTYYQSLNYPIWYGMPKVLTFSHLYSWAKETICHLYMKICIIRS